MIIFRTMGILSTLNDNRTRLILSLLFILMRLSLYDIELGAHEIKNNDTLPVVDTVQSSESMVYLINADEIRFSKRLNPDAQILVGNVIFRHDSMYMHCDSALFFQNKNSFNAYLNIKVEQGDTLFLFGDSLYYDGTTRIIRVRDNVRMENRDMVLLTDTLNYDRNINLGYFLNGGTLLDINNILTSDYGQYNTNIKVATFKSDVKLENPDFVLTSDTLIYNTDYHLTYIVSPTKIVSGDYTVNSSSGIFNTGTKQSILLKRSTVLQKAGLRTIVGDSIFYDNLKGYGECFGDVIVNDFENNVSISGNYIYFDELRDSAVVTGDALAVDFSQPDSLFLHADTFKIVSYFDDNDSLLYRNVRAFNRARGFRTDIQLVADSIEFDSRDSCLTLYNDPIVWSGEQQILGEVIKAYMNDSTLSWIHVINQALFVQRLDSIHYNQISGREMMAYFNNGELDRTYVNGNVQVVYYPEDEDSVMIGMNTTEASNLTAYFDNKEISKILITERSNGVLYPMDQLTLAKMYLFNFGWFDRIRPFSKWDVFYWRGKMQEEKLKIKSSRKIPLPTLN